MKADGVAVLRTRRWKDEARRQSSPNTSAAAGSSRNGSVQRGGGSEVVGHEGEGGGESDGERKHKPCSARSARSASVGPKCPFDVALQRQRNSSLTRWDDDACPECPEDQCSLEERELKVDQIAVMIGSRPSLGFLEPKLMKGLGCREWDVQNDSDSGGDNMEADVGTGSCAGSDIGGVGTVAASVADETKVDAAEQEQKCNTSQATTRAPIDFRKNPIAVDPYTFESRAHPGLYAIGPLCGDNFVRFVTGGALAASSSLQKLNNQNQNDAPI